MIARVKFLLILVLMSFPIVGFAQSITAQTDSARHAAYKVKIGLDLTVADFETNKIDARVFGVKTSHWRFSSEMQ